MAEVVTLARGIIDLERVSELRERYHAGVAAGLPPAIEQTFLLEAEPGHLAILSVWHRRADLEAMLTSGEEPFARRLIREAGGTPEVLIYTIAKRAIGG